MRRSPVHDALAPWRPAWGNVQGGVIAAGMGEGRDEVGAAATLALCDVSVLPKLGLKGSESGRWLTDQSIITPVTIYESQTLDAGLIVRTGADEFFLEDDVDSSRVAQLTEALSRTSGDVHHLVREDATFLVAGSRRCEVMAQTCGVNFAEAPSQHLIMTRVAGVSCAVLPESRNGIAVLRLWVDPSDAIYLWAQLAEIVTDLAGTVVGAACFYPSLRG